MNGDPHRGYVDALPHHPGGEGDDVDEWQGVCACGFKGRRTDMIEVAQGELVKHMNEALLSLAVRMREAEQERDRYTEELDIQVVWRQREELLAEREAASLREAYVRQTARASRLTAWEVRSKSALRRIAESYPWIEYHPEEKIDVPNSVIPAEPFDSRTPRRIARETLASTGGDVPIGERHEEDAQDDMVNVERCDHWTFFGRGGAEAVAYCELHTGHDVNHTFRLHSGEYFNWTSEQERHKPRSVPLTAEGFLEEAGRRPKQ